MKISKKQKVKLFKKLLDGESVKLGNLHVQLKNGSLFFKHRIDLEWEKLAITFDSFLELLGR